MAGSWVAKESTGQYLQRRSTSGGRPAGFALVEIKGRPNRSRNLEQNGSGDILSPTLLLDPRRALGTIGSALKINVNGPGQNRLARIRARSSIIPSCCAISNPSTWHIRGLNRGRPLTSKIRATAWPSVASAARPYTVSVGIATRPPRANTVTARSIRSGRGCSPNCSTVAEIMIHPDQLLKAD